MIFTGVQGRTNPAAVAGEPTIFLWLHLADIHPRIQIHLPNSHLDIQMGEGQDVARGNILTQGPPLMLTGPRL